jgi:hypothetical protein
VAVKKNRAILWAWPHAAITRYQPGRLESPATAALVALPHRTPTPPFGSYVNLLARLLVLKDPRQQPVFDADVLAIATMRPEADEASVSEISHPTAKDCVVASAIGCGVTCDRIAESRCDVAPTALHRLGGIKGIESLAGMNLRVAYDQPVKLVTSLDAVDAWPFAGAVGS